MSSTTFLVSCEWVRGHMLVVLFQSRLDVEELLTIQHEPWTLALSQNRNKGGGKKTQFSFSCFKKKLLH